MIETSDAGLRSATAEPAAGGDNPWPALIQKIQSDDASGMEELYRIFSRGVRFFLWRQMGPNDLEDTMHDTFVIVAQAIRQGEIRDPERLMGFVWTIVRRQVAAHIERTVNIRNRRAEFDTAIRLPDCKPDPEWAAIVVERQDLAHRLLSQVSRRDREILIRFYLKEQTQEQICREMDLTATQFRLMKSRAKARFGTIGRRKLNRRRICW
jgi:RNA polymerase sigma factor (sigma-70 family)